MDQSQYFVSLKKTHLKLTIFDLMIAIKCYLELDMYIWCNTVTIPEYVIWHIGFTDSLISIESSHEPKKRQFFPSCRSFYSTDEEKTQDFEMEHTSRHHHRAKLISTLLLYSNSHSEVTLRFAARKYKLIVTLTTPNLRSNLKFLSLGVCKWRSHKQS